jgi:hypothetical protein
MALTLTMDGLVKKLRPDRDGRVRECYTLIAVGSWTSREEVKEPVDVQVQVYATTRNNARLSVCYASVDTVNSFIYFFFR